jgi:hypothetical protein
MVSIPECIWTAMLDAFAEAPPNVERVAYLDGVGAVGEGTVTTVTIPDADLHVGWYEVSAEAMSLAARHGRRYRLVRLAQVHTHGGSDCEHSPRDDQMAYSQRAGSLSIVLPHHARQRPAVIDARVHVRTDSGWDVLGAEMATKHVRSIPSVVNLRSTPWKPSRIGTKATREAFWRRWLPFRKSPSPSK